MKNEQLIEMAKLAMANSYSPYSKFKVGAALVCKDGSVFTGCNVENASYGLCNCAERTAIFKAVSEGKKEFEKMAIVCDGDCLPYPCGACRQVMSEFAPNLAIVVADAKGEYKIANLKKLLPNQFSL